MSASDDGAQNPTQEEAKPDRQEDDPNAPINVKVGLSVFFTPRASNPGHAKGSHGPFVVKLISLFHVVSAIPQPRAPTAPNTDSFSPVRSSIPGMKKFFSRLSDLPS